MFMPSNISARSESRGETLTLSKGTNITASATANTKGSWVDLGSTTSFAYEHITVCLIPGTGSAVDLMMDIGISDGANRFVIAADLHYTSVKSTFAHALSIGIPLHVPSGTQLSARCAASVGSSDMSVIVSGHSSGLGGAPGFSRCVALFTPALSRGIAIDPGGTANTKGAWADITTSCPNDISAMFGLVGFNGDVARAAAARSIMDIGVGAAAAEYVLYPNAFMGWSTFWDGPFANVRIPPFACHVPATTRIAARSACSLTTAGDRTFDLALYGMVL